MLMSQRTIMVVISNLLYKLFAIPMVFEDACAQKVLDSSIKMSQLVFIQNLYLLEFTCIFNVTYIYKQYK